MLYAGLDIGGANLKFATTGGDAMQIAFPIWKDKHRLTTVLTELAATITTPVCLGVTMTAELADCFANKREGVEFVVRSVMESLGHWAPMFYQTQGELCDPDSAIENWKLVAASNWHALAWWAFQNAEQNSGFVFDIGSTTTDLIPVKNGSPVTPSQTDRDRLTNGQLVYAGMTRTPVCSLLNEFQLMNGRVGLARELFATTADAMIWLGYMQPEPDSCDTADGRPATRRNSGQRLAKMICADYDDLDFSQITAIAEQIRHALRLQIADSLKFVVSSNPSLPLNFVTSGQGGAFANEILLANFPTDRQTPNTQTPNTQTISIRPISRSSQINRAAPALAVAKKREQYQHQPTHRADPLGIPNPGIQPGASGNG